MSKYGEFYVVRTERHRPKKLTNNVDEDGMRDYSFLKCPHCQKGDIEILTCNLVTQKYAVIRDHMMICTEYNGIRPVKRKAPAMTIDQATQTPDEWEVPKTSPYFTMFSKRIQEENKMLRTKLALFEHPSDGVLV